MPRSILIGALAGAQSLTPLAAVDAARQPISLSRPACALRRYGQLRSGLVEDALVVGGSWCVVNRMGREPA